MSTRNISNPEGREDLHEFFAEFFAKDPIAADRAFFGRESGSDRRGFLRGAGLATMAAMAGTGGAAAPAPVAPSPAHDLGFLVAGEGAFETHAYCTACHSERIVAQQGLTRPDWDELLEQMVEEHEMTPIEEPDRARVLDYLAAHYGPDRPNFPRPNR